MSALKHKNNSAICSESHPSLVKFHQNQFGIIKLKEINDC